MYIKKIRNVFHHLKLDITLAITSSNDEKQKQTIQQDKG